MTDVPFGLLLSGGLDSSLVASITARYLADTKAGKQLGTTIHSFCIGLEVSSKQFGYPYVFIFIRLMYNMELTINLYV